MKKQKRWLWLLDEAPFPALALAFAVSQSLPGSDLKRELVARRGSPVAVQVDEDVQRILDSRGVGKRTGPPDDTARAYFWLFSAKTQSTLDH
jgi:hypothetical protein